MNVDVLCDGSSGNLELERAVLRKKLDEFELWKARQRKYGPGNISAYGEVGCVVRASDKLARLSRFYFEEGAEADFADDSLVDAWIDLSNYGTIGNVCHSGQWPGVPGGQAEKAEVVHSAIQPIWVPK